MSGEIQIDDFGEMQTLITELQTLQSQSTPLCLYVDEWVCNKEGFTPSDVCALQGLADCLPAVSGFFWDAAMAFTTTMGNMIEAVATTMQDYQTQEGEVVTSMDALLGRIPPEEMAGGPGRRAY